MVSPSAFSKDSATAEPTTATTSSAGQEQKRKAEVVGSTYKTATLIIPPTPISGSKPKVKNKVIQEVIMNPVVLSMISHFPNKCIPNKSQKYVINNVLTTVPSPDNKDNKKIELNNNSKNFKATPNPLKKKKPSTRLKRYAGLLLAILSSMMFSFTGLIVKIINHHHPLTQATWMFIATAIVALPVNIIRYIYVYKVHSSFKENEKRLDKKESDPFEAPTADVLEPVKLPESLGPKGIATKKDAKCDTLKSLTADTVKQKQREERIKNLKVFLLLLVRACSGCSGMILYFYSLKYLNVGDSLVIVCSSPIFVFIIGYLFLGESCGVIPVLTIFLSMVGVAVITRPPMLTGKETFQAEDMIGAGLAFSSMLCIAMTIILMRFLQNVYHGLINLVFAIWGSIQTTSLALAVGVLECPRNTQDAMLMGTTGVLFFLGQTFLAVALQFEEAGPVSLVRTSEVVFAFIWQFIFLNIAPDLFSISGAGLIMAGIFLTISRKWVAAMPEDSNSKKMFGFLLR